MDYRISPEEIIALEALNCNVVFCEPCNKLYPAICGHPDILLHFFDSKNIIVHKDTSKTFIDKLNSLNLNVIQSHSSLNAKYPEDIILNAVNTSSIFLHNIKFTDKNLLKLVSSKNTINVNQGYTKCSTVVLSDNVFITSDKSIHLSLSNKNCDVLLLPPGDIVLPHLDYGFIGGTCGMLDNNTIVFYGSLDYYSYGSLVKSFLKKHNINPIYLSESPLIDRGSIFFLDTSSYK